VLPSSALFAGDSLPFAQAHHKHKKPLQALI
jgi:hypothetical protein